MANFVVDVNASNRKNIPTDQIDFDVDNPRIQLWLDTNEKNEANVRLALGAEVPDEESKGGTTLRGLKTSIKTNKGIINPIIVREQEDGRYLVIEGNTRLMIYREFEAKEIEGDWNEIPCDVYLDIEQESIHAIRLQAHQVGPRPWDPYSKARYLNQLQESGDIPFKDIVDFCGGDSGEVYELLSAYSDMEEFYREIVEESGEKFDPSRFSAFVVLQQKSINTALTSAGFDKGDFAKWVHKRKIFPLQTARSLPRILKNQKAIEILQGEGAKAALIYLDTLKPGGGSKSLEDASLEELARELTQRLLKMTREEEAELRSNPDGDDTQMLIQLESELGVLCSYIREN